MKMKGTICSRDRIHLVRMIFELTHRIAYQSVYSDSAFADILSFIETPLDFDSVEESNDGNDEEPF